MRRQEKNIQNKRQKNALIALGAVTLVVGYALFAQPLAHRLAVKVFDKVNDVFKPYDVNKNDNTSNNANNNNTNNNIANNGTNNSGNTQNDGNTTNDTPSTPMVSDKWNISFTKVIKTGVYGYAREVTPVTFDALSASFDVALTDPDDKIVYEFTITNKGQLNARLENIRIVPENRNSAIKYTVSGLEIGDKLKVGESTTMTVTVSYDDENNNVKYYNESIKIIIDYVQD